MRYLLANAVIPLEYQICGNLVSRNGFLHPARCIDCVVLILVKEGTLYIRQEQENFQVPKNGYVFLFPGEKHSGYCPSKAALSYHWVHFAIPRQQAKTIYGTSKLQSILSEMGRDGHYMMPENGKLNSGKKTSILFSQLLDLSRNNNLYSMKLLDYALSLLVLNLSQDFLDRSAADQDKVPYQFVQMKEWICSNYEKELSVAFIAEQFGYHPDYLSSAFKRYYGCNLTDYLRRVRLEKAKELLSVYGTSVKEAAYSCGFQDEKYFMKLFKKQEAMTPNQYKNAFSQKLVNNI